VGTPALTSRGMKEAEMRTIAAWIAEVVKDPADTARQARVLTQVAELTASYPLRAEE
jgi:glycine hydroxymethyltransferase